MSEFNKYIKGIAIVISDRVLKYLDENEDFISNLEYFKEDTPNLLNLQVNENNLVSCVVWKEIGFEHSDIYSHLNRYFVDPKLICGFIDNDNNFLTRLQAYDVAFEAGQIKEKYKNNTSNVAQLYSYMLNPYKIP